LTAQRPGYKRNLLLTDPTMWDCIPVLVNIAVGSQSEAEQNRESYSRPWPCWPVCRMTTAITYTRIEY